MSPNGPPLIFLIFCNRMDIKNPKVFRFLTRWGPGAKQFGPPSGFRVLWKRILYILKSLHYIFEPVSQRNSCFSAESIVVDCLFSNPLALCLFPNLRTVAT